MISTFSSALSGISAFATQIAVVAHNTANVQTEDYEKSRAVLRSTHSNGVEAHIETIPTQAPMAMPPMSQDTQRIEPSNVDLAEEMTTLMIARRAYQANLNVVKAEQERVGHLLNIVG